MATSHQGQTGKNPWSASPRTGGPLGTNRDAANPETPQWFCGDTPGHLGCGDYADPNGRMFQEQMCIDPKLDLARCKRERECEIVQQEIEEARKLRDAFADKKLIADAKNNNWSAEKYRQKVAEKVFGKPGPDGEPTYNVPMELEPYGCDIRKKWDLDTYRRHGLPDIIYEADLAHEASHRNTCLKNMGTYPGDMSFPGKGVLSADEIKAYTVKIEVLEKWLRENCIVSVR